MSFRLPPARRDRVRKRAATLLRAYVENGLAGVAVIVLPVVSVLLVAVLVGGLVALAPFAFWFGTLSLLVRYEPRLFAVAIGPVAAGLPLPVQRRGRQTTLDEY